jgi:hypothetical protein
VVGPEVEAAMHRSALERAARGMGAVVFLTQDEDALWIADAQWRRIYDGTGVVFRVFREEAPARAWLREQVAA